MKSPSSIKQQPRRDQAGMTLVEVLVGMTLGLLLTAVIVNVYVSSKNSTRRLSQLTALQQSVRVAFDYLSNDARMAGYQGCFTRKKTGFVALAATNLATNFALGVEGYNYNTTAAYTLTSNTPAETLTAGNWTNSVATTFATIPVTTLSTTGLTPGSDVLIVRTAGAPVRLTANVAAAAATVGIENNGTSGVCRDGTTARFSGFCAKNYAMIASCSNAQAFQLSTGTPSASLAVNGTLAAGVTYAATTSEVFPVQTIAYYVRTSSSGTTTSLYRRVFDGDSAAAGVDAGVEQELVEGVETMQIQYGVDTTTPEPDGVIDGSSYVTADAVADWTRIVAVRMNLLLRSTVPVEGDVTVDASDNVGEVAVTYPTAGPRFDRRVFTTTVAVRNAIKY